MQPYRDKTPSVVLIFVHPSSCCPFSPHRVLPHELDHPPEYLLTFSYMTLGALGLNFTVFNRGSRTRTLIYTSLL